MRRLFSMWLLAVFLLPLLAPLMATGQDSEAGLPACCRRNGKHHCMMSMGERSRLASRDPRLQAPPERCPFAPATVSVAHHDRGFGPATGMAIFAGLVSHPGGSPQVESKRRIARDRSRQKRGPPAQMLSL